MRIKKICSLLLASLVISTVGLVGCSGEEQKDDKQNITVEASKDQKSNNQDKEVPKTNEEDKKESDVKSEQTLGNFKLHFIDTGNSDAIFIEGEKNLLIDGGENGDEKIIVPYLKNRGIERIDYIIGTHPHADHIGGLDGVIEEMEVGQLLVANGDSDTATYKDFINAAVEKGLAPSVPLESATFDMGNGAYFKTYNTNGGKDENETSIITLFVNGEDKVLLTGDAEEETEHEVLEKMTDVDILKVGHHGSKTSTSMEFLEKVNPEFAVITVGENNRYGHPHQITMDKLQGEGIEIHRTDECGNIVFNLSGKGVSTECIEGSFNASELEKEESDKTNEENKSTVNKPQNQSSDKKVWLSATGSKYHTVNDCGNMNPDRAIQKNLSEVVDEYEDCSKC